MLEGFNLETKRYTWKKKNTNKKPDWIFLISETSLNDINETSLFAGYSSDHSLVYFNIQFGKFKNDESLWKFNNSLLRDKVYINERKQIIKEVKLKKLKAPSNFIAGRPKAALLFWFFGGFRCGVPLFIVMLVIY